MTFTTAPGLGPVPKDLPSTRVNLAYLRDIIACRRGTSAITEALTPEQAAQRASILLGQHRDHVHIPDDRLELLTTPSGLPKVPLERIAGALAEWVNAHPHHHVASAA